MVRNPRGGGLKLSRLLLNVAHPVGSIIQTTKTQAQFDPNTMLGGTWNRIEGKVLIGAGTSDAVYAIGETSLGRSAPTNLPQTAYVVDLNNTSYVYSRTPGSAASSGTYYRWFNGDAGYRANVPIICRLAAGVGGIGDPTKGNLPPYKVVNIWERTA